MSDRKQTTTFDGLAISPGVAVGKAYVYRDILQRGHEQYDIMEEDVDEEWARITDAVAQVRAELEKTEQKVEARVDTGTAQIFAAQQAMLQDPQIMADLKAALTDQLVNAEHVVKQVFLRWERKLQQLSREDMKQPGEDIADIARRLLLVLNGIHAHTLENMPDGSVLVARRLLPSDTVFLSRKSTAAIVVEQGGRVSHAAILTRELGVPGVSRITDVLERIEPGDVLFVDGDNGEIIVNPDPDSKKTLSARIEQRRSRISDIRTRCMAPAVTGDGTRIVVLANVGCKDDVELAVANGADGVGLYRTEHIYLSRQSPPSKETIVERIQQSLDAMDDKPVTLRLLDAGGDKHVPFLNTEPEQNPFLGRRGIRLLLDFPDLLKLQLRAFLELAGDYQVRILVPMVTLAEEMEETRSLLRSLAEEAGVPDPPPLGAMIETPASALCVSDIARHSDFLSVGTNDLTQYTMVAGRENAVVGKYFIDDHPAIFRLLETVVKESNGCPVSICGELAGRSNSLNALLELGISTISVAPPLIPEVKDCIRNTEK